MVEKINARARHSTELINLVQLQRQFQNLASNDKSNDQKVPRLQSEAQTQTDTHIKVCILLKKGNFCRIFPQHVFAIYKNY